MKLQFIIDNIIKDKYNSEEKYLDFSIFEDDLNISYMDLDNVNYEKNNDLRAYFISSHLCTDTDVGIKAYFLKEECVCVTKQTARKSPEVIFGWVSEELAQKTKDYILSLIHEKNNELNIDILDLNFDMKDGYGVEYTEQMTSKVVFYKGETCTVLEDKSNGYTNFHNIKIEFKNKEIEIDVRDCVTPFRIIQNQNMFKR